MRANNLFQRISVAYNFIRYGRGKCRIMTCGKCGSICIVPISAHPGETDCIDEDKHIDLLWGEVVQCMKCGAVCHEIQCWNFEGDPTKLSKDFVAKRKQE